MKTIYFLLPLPEFLEAHIEIVLNYGKMPLCQYAILYECLCMYIPLGAYINILARVEVSSVEISTYRKEAILSDLELSQSPLWMYTCLIKLALHVTRYLHWEEVREGGLRGRGREMGGGGGGGEGEKGGGRVERERVKERE